MAENAKLQLTEEVVERILANYAIIEDAGDAIVTVGTVSTESKEGKQFYWEDPKSESGYDMNRPYAIVNLRAMSPDQMAKASDLFEQGEFEEAVGKEVGNLSLRMDIAEVEKHNLAKGSIVKATFDFRMNKADEEILVCVSVSPVKAKIGKNSFRERINEMKRERAKANAEQDANSENSEQQGAEANQSIPNASKAPTA
mgnify:CR=1 FL=1